MLLFCLDDGYFSRGTIAFLYILHRIMPASQDDARDIMKELFS
jgi:hypothetical protein